MSHHTPVPHFPANLSAYAPWVAKHGLVAPYGQCQCGCGQPAPTARKTTNSKGRRKGYPVRFIHGHNARLFDSAPDGFKTCTGCGEIKPVTDFRLRSGDRFDKYSARCKECERYVSRNYHEANRDTIIERSREYRQNNRAKLNATERGRRADPEYRKKRAVTIHDWRKRNADHVSAYNRSLPVKARAAVNKAVQNGELPPPRAMVCEHCQEALAAHYHHHSGYEREQWFDVVALCTECHGKEHWID